MPGAMEVWCRDDFAILPREWLQRCVAADMDTGTALVLHDREDHSLVSVSWQWPVASGSCELADFCPIVQQKCASLVAGEGREICRMPDTP